MTFLVHRWLGVGLGLLMVVWALSGIVMMYVPYPETTLEERAAWLEPLDLSGCCAPMTLLGDPQSAAVEMLAGQPVLRWTGAEGARLIPLASEHFPQIDAAMAERIAAGHMLRAFGDTPAVQAEAIERDQWTVSGSFRRHAPLYKASVADERGTVLYVSGSTGQIVQDTDARERFWNWLGAVPHWLYFTALRERPELWSDVVIYASLLGVFLTATGLYAGFRMYGRGKRRSPFRGLALWHHWTGLIFGVVTLTWVASGLFSMQPWGWFQSEGPGEVIENLGGRPLRAADVEQLYRALAANPLPGVVSAEASVQGGEAWAILTRSDGSRIRAALPGLEPAPLSQAELAAQARRAKPDTPIASAELITTPDAYHYSHHSEVILPAYRVIYADEQETRAYFSPRTGELIGFFDAPRQAFRWWHLALHRLDFAAVLRARPVWDLVTLPLMIGVSLLCLTGMWMGVRRLRRRERQVKRAGPVSSRTPAGR